MSLRFKKKSSN